jgi:hypothetical protein
VRPIFQPRSGALKERPQSSRLPWGRFSIQAVLIGGRFEQRPYIGAAPPARLADEQRLKIGQPDLIGPAVPIDLDMVRAFVVRAVDPQSSRTAGGPHFPKRDFLFALSHRRGLLSRPTAFLISAWAHL